MVCDFILLHIDNYNLSETPMIHNMCFTEYDCYCHRMAVIETPDVRSDHQHSQPSQMGMTHFVLLSQNH